MSSFGPSNTTKTAENNIGGTSNLLLNQLYPKAMGAGADALNTGEGNVNSGTNFLNTILGGNSANTSALLQPNVDQIRSNANNLNTAVSTLMPRGGGRSATLFDQAFQPSNQIQNLFNGARSTAATALPSIGLQQQGIGTNLFGLANNALSTASGANTNLAQLGQQDKAQTNTMWSGLGQGILGLATLPFGGGTAANGLLGLIGGKK